MKPRHVAQIRLDRSAAGEGFAQERDLPVRLNARGELRAAGEGFDSGARQDLVWDHRPVPLKPHQMIRPEPNAPLLKRIIRYPYELEPLRPVRVQIFDSSRPGPMKTDRDTVAMIFRLPREAHDVRNPMLTLDHEPELRPHPFRRRRIAADEEDAR